MSYEFASGWFLHLDEGPDWLFVRLELSEESQQFEAPLAESVWRMVSERPQRRVVFELTDPALLNSFLVGQLLLLYRRLGNEKGKLRLCGLSQNNDKVIKLMRLGDQLPNYENREAAVMGWQSAIDA